ANADGGSVEEKAVVPRSSRMGADGGADPGGGRRAASDSGGDAVAGGRERRRAASVVLCKAASGGGRGAEPVRALGGVGGEASTVVSASRWSTFCNCESPACEAEHRSAVGRRELSPQRLRLPHEVSHFRRLPLWAVPMPWGCCRPTSALKLRRNRPGMSSWI